MASFEVAGALHAQRHAADGPDPITPEMIGAATRADLDARYAKKADLPFTTPEAFGAAGDGVTDDMDALQAAVATGKAVRLRGDATYLTSGGLTLAPGQRLDGQGATIKRAPQVSTTTTTTITANLTTTITVADATPFKVGQDIVVLNSGTFDTNPRTITDVTGNDITVSSRFGITASGTTSVYLAFTVLTLTGDGHASDLRIDGNKAAWTFNRWQTTREVVTRGKRNVIERVYSNNAPGEGCVLFGDHTTLRDVWFTDLNGNGVHFSGASNPVVNRVTVINGNLDTNVGHADGGIILSNLVSHATITNCYVESCISGIGSIDSDDNSDVTIIGNTVVSCPTYGMDLVASQQAHGRIVMTGNRFYDCGPVRIANTNSTPTAHPHKMILSGNIFKATPLRVDRTANVSIDSNVFDMAGATTGTTLALLGNVGLTVSANQFIGGAYGITANGDTDLHIAGGNRFDGQHTSAVNITTDTSTVTIGGIYVTNDATASTSYNGVILRSGHSIRGATFNLTRGRCAIYPQSGAVVKDCEVRHGAATYSVRCDNGSVGIQMLYNGVTAPINDASAVGNNTVVGSYTLT